jgi:hypothetical protein
MTTPPDKISKAITTLRNTLWLVSGHVSGKTDENALEALETLIQAAEQNIRLHALLNESILMNVERRKEIEALGRNEVVEVTVEQAIDECQLWALCDNIISREILRKIAKKYAGRAIRIVEKK